MMKSLIVVISNYHMPRAIVELSHAMRHHADPVREVGAIQLSVFTNVFRERGELLWNGDLTFD
jgi:hypothetical protein